MAIPQDALTPIPQMLIAGRLKFVVMRGARFRYRSPRLLGYGLPPKLRGRPHGRSGGLDQGRMTISALTCLNLV